ncbi:MAG: flagellar hook protein FlgE [Betaproteobacteria bacterium]|nr:flagellar hook protein FlgE [Betaproteobacteria bacterium]
MSFGTGLSGLAAAAQDLDVIGNNVANSGTVGFKQSQIQFSDVYANSLSGAGNSQVGIGTKVADIAQQFTQGNITATSNPLDVAINGAGFFRMANNGTVTYTRNGQFQLNNTGYIVDANGDKLTGYTMNGNGVLSTGAPSDLNINTASLPPKMTSTVNAVLTLNATDTAPTTSIFSPNDPTSYNNATTVSVFDSLGNSHNLQTYYVTNGAGSWNVYATSDGAPVGGMGYAEPTVPAGGLTINGTSIGPISTGTATYSTAALAQAAMATAAAAAINTAAISGVSASAAGGVLTLTDAGTLTVGGTDLAELGLTAGTYTATGTTGTIAAAVSAQNPVGTLAFSSSGTITSGSPIALSVPVGGGAATPLAVSLNYAGTTQYGTAFSVNSLQQNGYTSGQLSNFNIGSDGMIAGNYTNGQTATLGQVVLANFTDPNGLQSVGNNQWVDTAASGTPLVGTPGSSSLGVLQSSATEDSNVDLTTELVDMITAQRNYQANAQTIKTEETNSQTLMNLR